MNYFRTIGHVPKGWIVVKHETVRPVLSISAPISSDHQKPWVLSNADAEMFTRVLDPNDPRGKARLAPKAMQTADASFLD